MFDFTDQVVLITGAAGNVGQAAAVAFYDAGARLALTDHHPTRLGEMFGGWAAERCLLLAGVDITEATAVQQMAAAVVEHYGRIDVLAHIAGGFRMGTPIHETPLETLEFLWNLNGRSYFLVAQAVVPTMLAQGSGKIVAVGARAALQGAANMGAYTVSKSAVVRITETLSAELKDQGIHVNCVLPSTIDTLQNRDAMPKANPDKWVTPEALADVLLFLASPAARAIHGAALPVYGRV